MADEKINLPRDASRAPMATDTYFGNAVKKTITFDGGTANATGDHDGTGDPFSIFKVTGEVVCKVLAICTTNLAGASSTVEVGTSNDTAEIIAQTTGTDVDAGDLWHDASPDSDVEASSVLSEKVIINGADIVGTCGTANVTAGVIDFYCYWYPITRGSEVEAA